MLTWRHLQLLPGVRATRRKYRLPDGVLAASNLGTHEYEVLCPPRGQLSAHWGEEYRRVTQVEIMCISIGTAGQDAVDAQLIDARRRGA